MQITTLKELYLAELQELASMERQLAASLLHVAEVVTEHSLRDALMRQRAETETQGGRLEAILAKHGAGPSEHTDQGMQGLLHETEKMINILKGNDLRDAGLLASVQRLKHYEIAGYGAAAALAGQLDLREEQEILHASLEEEKQDDVLLTQIARRDVNPEAAKA